MRQLTMQKIDIRFTSRSAVRSLDSSALQPDLRILWNSSIFQRCGWRTSTKTREKWAPPSSSNSRFSPRKIGRATAGLRTKKAPTRPGLQVDRRRKSPEGQISGPPEDSLKREACNPKKGLRGIEWVIFGAGH